uniref:glutathione transferase n=1 Tax=Plectus sambesii TaxID=2011161 RepID=A0A914WFF1_9BILA
MPHYKLTYFNLYGRAETSRILFHLAGVPYDDVRIEMEEWAGKKSDTRWGFLPELEVDGKKLAQSYAIHLYLAKIFGFGGKDEWETARILEFLLAFEEVFIKLYAPYIEKDPVKKDELTKSAIDGGLKPLYNRLEKSLEENGNGYLVGNQLTVADIGTFVMLTGIEEFQSGVLSEFTKLVTFVKRIEDEPKVKEWIEKRPKCPFSVM